MEIKNLKEAIVQYEILEKRLTQAFNEYEKNLITQEDLILSVYRVEGYPRFSIDNEDMKLDKTIEIKFVQWLYMKRVRENNKRACP
ncbi:hypothetical protein [Pectobacterium betavasculorum]|uniref:Colicin immunity protein n=1 Tax=Pectobacterium betavasculorum TaxID=55207 RepID=A0ABR4UV72_9GAMM|nr:hypothetical protein [Pectobacterium betavasculorum]KFX15308.1 hypothetical protein JV35_18735 [Pectobacterium betavasculorum]